MQGRRVIVTGAASGMGKAIAELFAAEGASLALLDRDAERLAPVAKTLAVKAKWPLKDCANPTAITLDAPDHRIFSVCANQVMAVTDSVSGKAITRIVIGRWQGMVWKLGYRPDSYTLRLAQDGMYFETGSSSWNSPRS